MSSLCTVATMDASTLAESSEKQHRASDQSEVDFCFYVADSV